MRKTYQVLPFDWGEIIEENGQFRLSISLQLEYSAEGLIKLGSKITCIGFNAIEHAVDREEIMERCEKECRAFAEGLKNGS